MFCKWCGKKISDNGAPCPSCGQMQPPLESGNGFWDLCEPESGIYPDVNANRTGAVREKKPGDEPIRAAGEKKPAGKPVRESKVRKSISGLVLMILCCVLSVSLLICLWKIIKYNKEISALRIELTELETQIARLNEENYNNHEDESNVTFDTASNTDAGPDVEDSDEQAEESTLNTDESRMAGSQSDEGEI